MNTFFSQRIYKGKHHQKNRAKKIGFLLKLQDLLGTEDRHLSQKSVIENLLNIALITGIDISVPSP